MNDSGPPPGATVVINETFDGTPSCGAGWTVVNGTLSPDGAGGCKLCATSTQGIYIELTATAPKGGSASVEAWVKRPQGTTAPTSVSVTLTASSSTISGSTGITESYTKLSPGKVTAQAGGAITPRIGMSSVAVGDCIILDAVRVIIN